MVLLVVPVYKASLISFIKRRAERDVSFTELSNESFSTRICRITLPLNGWNTASFLTAPLFSVMISSCPLTEMAFPNLPSRPFLWARKKTVSSVSLCCEKHGNAQQSAITIARYRYEIVRRSILPWDQLVIICGKLRFKRLWCKAKTGQCYLATSFKLHASSLGLGKMTVIIGYLLLKEHWFSWFFILYLENHENQCATLC